MQHEDRAALKIVTGGVHEVRGAFDVDPASLRGVLIANRRQDGGQVDDDHWAMLGDERPDNVCVEEVDERRHQGAGVAGSGRDDDTSQVRLRIVRQSLEWSRSLRPGYVLVAVVAITPAMFESQLKMLSNMGYHTVTARQVATRLRHRHQRHAGT